MHPPIKSEQQTNDPAFAPRRSGALSWERNPFRELVRLAWPIVVSLLSVSLMTLTDSIFAGRLGPAALGAVGLGGVCAFTVICFGLNLLVGAKIRVSHALGAGQAAGAERLIGAFLWLGLGLGFATSIVTLLLAPLLPSLADSAEVGRLARGYVEIRALGAPVMLVSVAIAQVRLGLGDSRSSMRAAVTANLANIPLNALFIFGLKLGVEGAAWATVASRFLELGMLIHVQRQYGFFVRSTTRRDLRAVFETGLPTAIERTLDITAFSFMVVLIAGMSEADLAGHQIALQVSHFSFLPIMAVAEAVTVLTAQAVGANADHLLDLVKRAGGRVTLGYAALFATGLAIFAEPIARVFTSDPQALAVGVRVLHVAAGLQLLNGYYHVTKAVLRGAGDLRIVAVVTVVAAWVFAPPLTYLLGVVLGLGAVGGWLALCVEVAFGTLVLQHRLRTEGWRDGAVRARASFAVEAGPGFEASPRVAPVQAGE